MLLYTPESVKRLDAAAVEIDGYSEIELMQRAGRSVWQTIVERWPEISTITIFAAAGNNGGDAFVVANCALAQSVEVQLIVAADLDAQSDTARHFFDRYQASGGSVEQWQQQSFLGELIVDGLLGIGLDRALNSDWQSLITSINQSGLPVISIDLPSGLNALTGIAQPLAINADLTITFIAAKVGLLLADGPDYCGELIVDALGISERAMLSVPAVADTIDKISALPPRRRNSHKNDYGHVLVLGGDQGMSGAVALAARAAMRTGAGMVSALVHPDCCNNLTATPELMVQGWNRLEQKLESASVVVVGPGLGDSEAAIDCLRTLSRCSLPMVVDASALTPSFLSSLESKQLLITPHPGEAGRLLGVGSGEVQRDRLDACRQLVEKYSVSCVLKGAGTLVADSDKISINTRGNPGMATAGMGDVLAGMIAALHGQGMLMIDAARSAVLIHALAADLFATTRHPAGLIASDVIERIPTLMRQLVDE